MSRAKYPIRRSQLIAPFGVGAMTVVKGGTSLICAGLDHWYKRENTSEKGIDENEFKVEEYRLEKVLQVDHFRLPPDYREPKKNISIPNTDLGVPFLRFPQWHVCPRCDLMKFSTLNRESFEFCNDCKENEGKRVVMSQMPFVAMCEDGHLQDVPWNEFVHRSFEPECGGKLKYLSSGGAALAAQKIRCLRCLKERFLGGIMYAESSGETSLSKNLSKEGIYLCRGMRPWLGLTEGEFCLQHLRVNLRGASNVWFSQVYSAIYIPQKTENCPPELLEFLRRPEVAKKIERNRLRLANFTIEDVREDFRMPLSDYTNAQIEEALKIISETANEQTAQTEAIVNEDGETAFRRVEYEVLRSEQNENLLVTQNVSMDLYDNALRKMFSRVMLVHKLRETRAFAGFTRVYAENLQKLAERKTLLRRENLAKNEDWLPATIVYGEGLFFELNEPVLRRWEEKFAEQLNHHLRPLTEAHWKLQKERDWKSSSLSARFVVLHTLAHLFINRLTFECGYSSASLRERIYVSQKTDAPMAGILIYTADGDSDGTLGGLVRMGQPGKLESVLFNALDHARWCSSDPVCREMGKYGQGPDSCNLAACHSCALIPETSCELFNRFLDRQILISQTETSAVQGFFDFAQRV